MPSNLKMVWKCAKISNELKTYASQIKKNEVAQAKMWLKEGKMWWKIVFVSIFFPCWWNMAPKFESRIKIYISIKIPSKIPKPHEIPLKIQTSHVPIPPYFRPQKTPRSCDMQRQDRPPSCEAQKSLRQVPAASSPPHRRFVKSTGGQKKGAVEICEWTWLVVFWPPLRKIWVRQLGWLETLFPIYGKIKLMFQTTNQ